MTDRREYKQQYRLNHKDEIKQYSKEYYEEHRDKILEYKKEYRENNKDKMKSIQFFLVSSGAVFCRSQFFIGSGQT